MKPNGIGGTTTLGDDFADPGVAAETATGGTVLITVLGGRLNGFIGSAETVVKR